MEKKIFDLIFFIASAYSSINIAMIINEYTVRKYGLKCFMASLIPLFIFINMIINATIVLSKLK